MQSLLISILLSFGVSVATATACCWFHLRRLRKRFSLRTSVELSNEISQLQSDLASTVVTVKRLHAKVGMREVRGRRAQVESSSVDLLPGESRAQWKERLRKQHFGE